MNLIDLLEESGGGASVSALAKQLGIGGRETGGLVAALAPALMRGIERQTESPDTLGGLMGALNGGHHQRYLDEPDLLGDDATRQDGNKILGHLFGSKDVSRKVAAEASRSTGLDQALIKKALPLLAGLAMGALSRKRPQAGSGETGLGDLLGGLLGGGSRGGLDLDGLMGFARKLF